MTVDPEFSLLPDNAAEAGLPWRGDPVVRRVSVELAAGRTVSALAWGDARAQVVLLHGGGQNAHTFDTLALALDRPALALDLPGHGHSAWRSDHDYSPGALASDISAALDVLAPGAQAVVGMSLGGLAALCLAATHPDQVARLALIDITPGTDAAKAEPVLAFMAGPERFTSFEQMLDRTVAFNPTRSVSSLRRGVIHNARELPDGSWSWRWDPEGRTRGATGFESLWPAVDSLHAPLLLVRGARSSVVSDDDVAELLHRQPGAQVQLVADAGHSIQGDQPIALARILERFLS